jgi:hypothetical protein
VAPPTSQSKTPPIERQASCRWMRPDPRLCVLWLPLLSSLVPRLPCRGGYWDFCFSGLMSFLLPLKHSAVSTHSPVLLGFSGRAQEPRPPSRPAGSRREAPDLCNVHKGHRDEIQGWLLVTCPLSLSCALFCISLSPSRWWDFCRTQRLMLWGRHSLASVESCDFACSGR